MNLIAYNQHELLSHIFSGFANEIFKNPVKIIPEPTWKASFYVNETVCHDSTLLFSQRI